MSEPRTTAREALKHAMESNDHHKRLGFAAVTVACALLMIAEKYTGPTDATPAGHPSQDDRGPYPMPWAPRS